MKTYTINPEGYTRGGATCTCGPLYHYGGAIEPGQFRPDCPEHGDPDYYESIADNLDWIGEWRGRRG